MPQPKTFYITTPIYYVNAAPHLGHAFSTIFCDIMTRYHKMLGQDSYFLTGTDEYGQNIARVAEQTGQDTQAMVDANSAKFRNLWPQLGIQNDDFIRTTEDRHKKVVQTLLQKTFDSGDIYQAEYGGDYCVKCERFFTKTETEATPGMCPIHKMPLERIMEKNYFFRLSKYQDWLREKIESDPQFLMPAQFRSEVLAFLREPLEDLCISRPIERMSWGIPLPFDKGFVTYVWYDALVNYISALGWPDGEKFKKYWPEATHLMAKDILRQHAIYWPCILKAAGIEPPKRLRIHGWWTVEGEKMSKSLGNVIVPIDEANRVGLDIFRYFIVRDMTFGSDGDYSAKSLIGRNNSELANDLGNLLCRITTMVVKYFDGKMPSAATRNDADNALLAEVDRLIADLPDYLEKATLNTLLERVNAVVVAANKYVTDQAPWSTAKKGDLERTGTILAVTSQALVAAAKFYTPVMPNKMAELLAAYGLPPATDFANAPVPAGTLIVAAQPLFAKMEMPAEPTPDASASESPVSTESTTSTPSIAPQKPEIEYDDFAKIDLRVATILEAERVPKTDKLMRLSIDVGFEKRQIVAGIAAHYKPEDLIGKQIIVVANLAPRKLKGLTSQGMLLAAKAGDDLFVLHPGSAIAPGADVS
ncbi:TPA: methionine--tRNA ligase [Candidatus Sumerlaeota bacterium]|jgi:methionyl-tRNA synthetase|nr:methionine--tRNA ligase [Candidatus Sumerlaeota bacterium]